MNASPFLQTQWQKSTVRRCLRWLFSWRSVRALVISVAALATLIGLFYAVENWRGSSAWRQCRRELESQGEKLDFRDFIPPPVPDEQNFAMSPLLKAVVTESSVPTGHTKWNLPDRFGKITATEESPGRRNGKKQELPKAPDSRGTNFLNLAAWQAFYRGNTNYPQPAVSQSAAADVLLALSRFDAELKELQDGAVRPHARFLVPYGDTDPFAILLPHLGRMKAVTIVLTLRATARLELGQPQAALDDLKLALRLADTVKTEPILISYLVRLASYRIILQGIGEGLARRAWNDAQLAELGKLLGGVDFLTDYQWIMRGERAWGLAGLDYWCQNGPMDMGVPGYETFLWSAKFAHYFPSGWINQNKAALARLHQQLSLAVVDDKAGRVFPDRSRAMEQALSDLKPTPYNFFSKLLLPAISKVALRSARCQTLVNQAIIASALERYRLAHGEYPDTLEPLAPQFLISLPHDLIRGGPLRYSRGADGSYSLVATGWNQPDEDSQPGANSGRRALTAGENDQDGDWIWRSH